MIRPTWPTLLRTDYQGCRYAFGYPACPDLEDRVTAKCRHRPA
ncbi:hypothetical protein JMF97_17595 [Micromonospora fiedleri]|uniref:AdoMet activation domain-containing protein n=1 Tax=Micromonospora fiedleri TaxID=1157498 RepID=A0ABS1UNP0_9ACTN|nr:MULTISPECIES: vitamin B12 dependent-methionine synthase activation domain-containing protein [Micromonospora]MBL6277972.1 hypothetical protein [Micromonospora fiedleri]WSK41083.1 hypothetical protein OG712_21540 [Micromonospora maris]